MKSLYLAFAAFTLLVAACAPVQPRPARVIVGVDARSGCKVAYLPDGRRVPVGRCVVRR